MLPNIGISLIGLCEDRTVYKIQENCIQGALATKCVDIGMKGHTTLREIFISHQLSVEDCCFSIDSPIKSLKIKKSRGQPLQMA